MRVAASKLGRELVRFTAVLCRDRLVWQGCGSRGLESNVSALFGQLCAGFSFSSRVGCRGSAVRFYSQTSTGWQALNGSAGQSSSAQNPGYTADDDPSLPEAIEASDFGTMKKRTVPLYVELKECQSATDVLDVVDRHPLTLRGVSSSLTRIWETAKQMSEEQGRYERQLMFDHPAFDKLCTYTMQRAVEMRCDDLTFSLLAVVKLGVPQRSRLVQTLLRTIQEKLNEFDEKALSVLAGFLGEMESSRNVDALRTGLRLLVEDRVWGIKGVVPLQSLMRFVGKDAPLPLKRKLEKKALSMANEFSTPNAQHMVTTLAVMNFASMPLLDICSKKIAESIHTVPYTRLINMLKACKDLRFMDSHLLSAVAEHLTSTFDMWSNKQLIFFLLKFEDLRFRPVALLDRFLEKVIQDPNSLTLKDVLSVLKVCSRLNHVPENHKQEFFERMSSVLESYLLKMAPADLLRGVFFLCILGHFPFAPVETLLRRETLDELTKDDQFLQANQRRLHHVGLCLQLDRPPFPEALTLPPGMVDLPRTRKTVTRNWGKLIQSMAGNAVIEEGVMLEKTYFIDCLITLPLERTDLNSPSDEDRDSPEPCRRVAVLFAPPSSFCLGTSHPRGSQAMMMRHLRVMGYTPVLVPEHEFDLLSEMERLEGLRRLIFPVKGEEARCVTAD